MCIADEFSFSQWWCAVVIFLQSLLLLLLLEFSLCIRSCALCKCAFEQKTIVFSFYAELFLLFFCGSYYLCPYFHCLYVVYTMHTYSRDFFLNYLKFMIIPSLSLLSNSCCSSSLLGPGIKFLFMTPFETEELPETIRNRNRRIQLRVPLCTVK